MARGSSYRQDRRFPNVIRVRIRLAGVLGEAARDGGLQPEVCVQVGRVVGQEAVADRVALVRRGRGVVVVHLLVDHVPVEVAGDVSLGPSLEGRHSEKDRPLVVRPLAGPYSPCSLA